MMTPDVRLFSDDLLARVRAATPGLSARIHMDNCGSSLMPQPVVDALKAALARDVAYGGYVAQEQQAERIEAGYGLLAQLLGGKATDYAFVGSAVDGWTKAFYSLPFEPGQNIVTAYNEYCSNYVAYLQIEKLRGVEIRVARRAEDGGIDLAHLKSLIDGHTALISISHLPSSSGEINQAAEVGQIARDARVLYLLDACQSAGHIPVDAEAIGCDMMTGTARKFLRGPRGIGFLYVNERARTRMEPVVLTNQSAEWTEAESYRLRDDTRVFEAWEYSVMNRLGFIAAIEYLLELGVEQASAQLLDNAAYLRAAIEGLLNVTMACPPGASSAIITFNVAGHQPQEVKAQLELDGIAVQVASVVHTRLDLQPRGIESAVRVSPHYFSTREEMDGLVDALATL